MLNNAKKDEAVSGQRLQDEDEDEEGGEEKESRILMNEGRTRSARRWSPRHEYYFYPPQKSFKKRNTNTALDLGFTL